MEYFLQIDLTKSVKCQLNKNSSSCWNEQDAPESNWAYISYIQKVKRIGINLTANKGRNENLVALQREISQLDANITALKTREETLKNQMNDSNNVLLDNPEGDFFHTC